MKFFIIFTIFSIVIFGSVFLNTSYAQIDPLSEILFFQTGELNTVENQFQISDNFVIREFFNGNIIRVSGQTLEGFPYITYSKILEDSIDTHGVIFINNQFVKLSFIEKQIQIEETENKNDDLAIAMQYTQRVHSKQYVYIDAKIFDKEQNKYNYFDQNHGQISNVNVHVSITDESNFERFSFQGITNDEGLIETEYLIPDNSGIETLTLTISAENDISFSSKILQVFVLGNLSNNG